MTMYDRSVKSFLESHRGWSGYVFSVGFPLYSETFRIVMLEFLPWKSIIQTQWNWLKDQTHFKRVPAKNTPPSRPLKGTILLTCHSPPPCLAENQLQRGKYGLHAEQSVWQQTQAAQCLATQDNRARNKDQHPNGLLSWPRARWKRTGLIYFWRDINNTVRNRWKKNKKVPLVVDKVDKDYI